MKVGVKKNRLLTSVSVRRLHPFCSLNALLVCCTDLASVAHSSHFISQSQSFDSFQLTGVYIQKFSRQKFSKSTPNEFILRGYHVNREKKMTRHENELTLG